MKKKFTSVTPALPQHINKSLIMISTIVLLRSLPEFRKEYETVNVSRKMTSLIMKKINKQINNSIRLSPGWFLVIYCRADLPESLSSGNTLLL